jgi:thymidylate synthase (FAD)
MGVGFGSAPPFGFLDRPEGVIIRIRPRRGHHRQAKTARPREFTRMSTTDPALTIVRDPKVYLVGRQTVDSSALDAFLADEGVSHWTTDTDVAGEKLIETAGRLCFDDDTEILTDRGWSRFENLQGSDRVLTLNPATRMAEFQTPLALQSYDFDGHLLCAEGRDISFAVTPEHRQYGAFATYGHASPLRFQFVRTDQIGGRRFKVLSAPAGWSGGYPASVAVPDYEYSQGVSNHLQRSYGTMVRSAAGRTWTRTREIRALAMLLVYYVTEGSLGVKRGVSIYGDHVAEVGRLCERTGLPYSVHYDPRNQVPRVIVGGGQAFRNWIGAECGKRSNEKRLPDWVLNLPTDDLAEIWRIMVKTDGHRFDSGREILGTTSTILAGQAQEILCKLGYSSAFRKSPGGTNCQYYTVSRKAGRPITLNDSVWVESRPYLGRVHCVTTENGVVYVRRNGLPHFSGNCYLSFAKPRPGGNKAYIGHILDVGHGSVLEHSVFNLIITGVSRSFTHEMIRHRAGFGYSQLSQRFVDESGCSFVEPDVIAGDPELHKVWVEAVGACQRAYKELADGLTAKFAHLSDRTLRRKKAREAARSVLPNATETKIFVTANARALRHFIEMRADPAADAEIRKVAVAVLKILQAESPNLFGDYTITDLPEGGQTASTRHRKV